MPRTPPRAAFAGTVETIFGSVWSLVYHNEQSGWTVAGVVVRGGTPGGSETATVVGSCTSIWEGEEVKATGRCLGEPGSEKSHHLLHTVYHENKRD